MRSRSSAALLFAPVLACLAVLLFVAVFVVEPSALGWIGFGVVTAVGLLVAGLAAVLYQRTRVNARRVHPRPDGPFRLLVVADVHCDARVLGAAVRRIAAGRVPEVLVVAPVLATRLHFLTDSEESERADARVRLTEAVAALGQLGLEVRGLVGMDDPLQAIGDALAGFPANEILLATSTQTRGAWLEQGLERRARDAFGVHVSRVDVDGSCVEVPTVRVA
jgi:hypothetical protein